MLDAARAVVKGGGFAGYYRVRGRIEQLTTCETGESHPGGDVLGDRDAYDGGFRRYHAGDVRRAALAALVMILGYGIIAVPTGIVTVELAQQSRKREKESACACCGCRDQDRDAAFCKLLCGEKLERDERL